MNAEGHYNTARGLMDFLAEYKDHTGMDAQHASVIVQSAIAHALLGLLKNQIP